MSRLLKILVVVSSLLILVVPTLNMVHPFLPPDVPIEGAVAETQRPAVSLSGLMQEDFQRGFTAWYEQHYSLRASATRLDNSIGYYVLHETRPDKHVKVGRDDVLFLDEQIWFNNRRETSQPAIDAFAQAARMAQDGLAARDIAFVVTLLPSKPTFYRDKIPDSWALPLGDNRPCDVTNYRPFVAAMRAHGVHFVDGRQLVSERLGGERDLIYSPTGRHLNAPAACIILEEAFNLVRAEVRGTIPHLDCRYERVLPPTPAEEEYDLLRLLNVFDAKPRTTAPQMVPVPEPVGSTPPNALFVGSSFGWKLIKEAERNHALGHTHFFYYNRSVVDRDNLTAPLYPVPPATSAEWAALALTKSIVILPLPEEYLPFHNGDFLLDTLRALGIDTRGLEGALKPP